MNYLLSNSRKSNVIIKEVRVHEKVEEIPGYFAVARAAYMEFIETDAVPQLKYFWLEVLHLCFVFVLHKV